MCIRDRDSGVGGQHLVGTTGYGTDDPGRDKLEPVSYTHLDVYKRQAEQIAPC